GVAPPPHLLPEVEVGAPVETLIRLVKQQHVWLAETSHDQVELLTGSTGQVPGLGPAGDGPVQARGVRTADGAGRRSRHATAGADKDEVFVGGEELTGATVLRAVAEGAVYPDRSTVRAGQPGADTQERALAASVGADHRGDLPGSDDPLYAGEDRLAPV